MVLEQGGMEIGFVVDSFHQKKQEKVLLALEYLLNEKMLLQKDDMISIHPNYKGL